MDLTSRVLLLLSGAVLFIIADAQELPKYDEFKGLVKSVEEDIKKSIYENRQLSLTRAALKAKQFNDTNLDPWSFFKLRKDGRLPFQYNSSSPVPPSVEEVVTSASETSSSMIPSGQSTLAPVKEKHKARSKSRTTSSPAPPTSSTAVYSTVTENQREGSTSKTVGSSAAPASSTTGYSTVAPGTVRTVTPAAKSASSSTVPPDEGSYLPSYKHPYRVGSIRGIPGEHFPNYTDIPITKFSCWDKPTVPGFYADLDAGCQVFHVCWSERRETFLCPVGTTFNQAILACDYWYSNNCSSAPQYYSVNMGDTGLGTSEGKQVNVSSMIAALLGSSTVDQSKVVTASDGELRNVSSAISFVSKFLPVKAKVTVYQNSKKLHSVPVSASADDDKQGSRYLRRPRIKNPVLATVVEGKEGSRYLRKSRPKDPVSTSRLRRAPGTTSQAALDDGLEASFIASMEEALYQAYDDLEADVAAVLKEDPLDENIFMFRDGYSAILENLLTRLQSGRLTPSGLATGTWPTEGKTIEEMAQIWRHFLVSFMRFLYTSLWYLDRSRTTEDPATVAPLTETYPTEDSQLATEETTTSDYVNVATEPETTSQAYSDDGLEDGVESTTEEAVRENLEHYLAPLEQSDALDKKMTTEKSYKDLPRGVLSSETREKHMPSDKSTKTWSGKKTSKKQEWSHLLDSLPIDSAVSSLLEELRRLVAEVPQPATVAPLKKLRPSEDPRLAKVAPLTKLNPRFITKPVEAGRKVSVKTKSKPSIQWKSGTALSKEIKKALLLNYLNFIKMKGKSVLYGLL